MVQFVIHHSQTVEKGQGNRTEEGDMHVSEIKYCKRLTFGKERRL